MRMPAQMVNTEPIDRTNMPLAGLRLLVVEDNFVLAESLKWALEGLGCQVIGPAPNSEKALELIDAGEVDAAILDIDLQGKTSAPVAMRMQADGRPFLFTTGYEDTSRLPDEFRGSFCLDKPIDIDLLTRKLLEQLGR